MLGRSSSNRDRDGDSESETQGTPEGSEDRTAGHHNAPATWGTKMDSDLRSRGAVIPSPASWCGHGRVPAPQTPET